MANPSYIPAVFHKGKKTFTVLENNPAVMTPLAHSLGLSKDLELHDVYSLTEPSILAFIPRPALALLVILPLTKAWNDDRTREDEGKAFYEGKGKDEPVIWFKQTIGHACGSIGLLHCVLNGEASSFIEKGSWLDRAREEVLPLGMARADAWKCVDDRAQWLYDNKEFEHFHQSVAAIGDTAPPDADQGDRLGQHFVAFVKGTDGHLWELEGSRKGPIDRGILNEDEDVLSPRAIERGIGRVIALDQASGGQDLRFSATALSKAT